MVQLALSERARPAQDQKVVVLLLPEALSGVDGEKLRATFAVPSAAIRLLVCLTERADEWLVPLLSGLGVEVQILVGPEVERPATTAFVLRAPSSMTPEDQQEFALALSDVVLAAPAPEPTPLTRTATRLGKRILAPGEALPAIRPLASISRRLDPDLPGWHSWGSGFFGRIEQSAMELLAVNWLGLKHGGIAESVKRLRRCSGVAWRPSSYFAPDAWRDLAPDRAAIDRAAKIVACFDELDRSALYGSYIHRDLTWIEHFLSAFAVLAAVAGALAHSRIGWGIVELATLAIVALLVMTARHTRLQDRWTACRMGAEQLRIARMSLPLLVLPPALATADVPPPTSGHGIKESEFGFMALAQVKRAIRDHGLPRLVDDFSPVKAAAWVRLIVGDQIEYHRRNNLKLERAEQRLRFATQGIFLIAVIAVVVHFRSHAEWLLLFTAAGPAFAATLHGVGTRLGIVHRAALSVDVKGQLEEIDTALAALVAPLTSEAAAWRQVRRLAFEAAKSMGQENTSWHGLVRRYRDDLP